jgi:hypothetical protein
LNGSVHLPDPELIQIETYLRQAIRDALYQISRKPFAWGGLRGYEQLQAIAQGLEQAQAPYPDTAYLQLLKDRVDFVLAKNRTVAEDLRNAHQILSQIANCLRYASGSFPESQVPLTQLVNSKQVAQEMERLIQQLHPSGRVQRAQIRLLGALRKRWQLYGPELLYCYEISGLPQDNLKLESLFGRFRRHQRRISGRKSTRELLDFGQAQLLFTATSFQELLDQIQFIPLANYQKHRTRLATAELPKQFIRRLHRNPQKSIQALVSRHTVRAQALAQYERTVRSEQPLHTE